MLPLDRQVSTDTSAHHPHIVLDSLIDKDVGIGVDYILLVDVPYWLVIEVQPSTFIFVSGYARVMAIIQGPTM